MLYRGLITLVKLALASLIVGYLLSAARVDPEQLLRELGLSPEQIMEHVQYGAQWALPYLILGAIVIVPVWLIVSLFTPPKKGPH